MNHRIPELAEGLTLHPQPDGRYALQAPDGRRALLGPAPIALLLLVDGRRTLEIIEVVAEGVGLALPAGALANVLLPLEQAGFVRFVSVAALPHSVLPATKHTCEGCGRSCEGHLIGPLPSSELQTIQSLWPELQRLAPRLQGKAPFQRIGGRLFLATLEGRCLFLDADKRCDIHRHFGADAKPAFCRMFPTVRVLTEQGLRIGVAPRCFRHHGHGQPSLGPIPAPAPLQGALAELPAPTLDRDPLPSTPFHLHDPSEREGQRRWLALEAHLLDLLGAPETTLAELARGLGAQPAASGPATASALLTLLRRVYKRLEPSTSELGWVLDGHSGVAETLHELQTHLADCLDTLTPTSPLPTWTAAEERWLLSSLRSAVFLREPILFPDPLPALATWIAGFLLAAFAARHLPEPQRYDAVCTSFVAWLRLISEADDFERLAISRPISLALMAAVAIAP